MHMRLEVIMPPTSDVGGALDEVLKPYDEGIGCNDEDEDACCNPHAFWDWWQIGGRFSGQKIYKMVDQERLDAFYALLNERGVTVSGIVFGKQTLRPESQAPMVDALWREHFPEMPFEACPLFDHAGESLPGDVTKLAGCRGQSCSHLIVADGEGRSTLMLQKEIWNGATHQKTAWDGTIASALQQLEGTFSHCRPEWVGPRRPTDDWLVVTVDYHS